ncbi:MAG: hypothetical protein ACRCZP_01880 [Phycicoccus sp.]
MTAAAASRPAGRPAADPHHELVRRALHVLRQEQQGGATVVRIDRLWAVLTGTATS